MSQSTLRRKLQVEGSSLQAIKDRVKLGYGLHLLQTTMEPVGIIAEKCGYYSQSRFTDRFKQLFGLTPTELRKTRVID
jgi:AraC-like DNA-binding protein